MSSPSSTGRISVRAVEPVVRALEALGFQTAGLLKAVGIDAEVLKNVEGHISARVMGDLWRGALEASGDEHLGIHLAEAAPIRSFGVHAYALLSSATLRQAFRRASRYQRLIHETNELLFEEGPDGGVLRHRRPGGLPVGRHPAEFLMTLWVRFGRRLTGTVWPPRLVCFAHEAPPDRSEHERVFRCPVRFSTGRTELYVDNDTLDTRNPGADTVLAELMDRYAGDLLKQAPAGTTTSERVRQWLINEMNGGNPTAAGAASALFVSERTLYRHLKQEGTTFRSLLDQLRHERATQLLAKSQFSLAEVGFLLGFSELSAFYRAFKRWTGMTPAAFRKGMLGQGHSISSTREPVD